MKLDILDIFSKNTRTPNLMKIRLVGAQLFLADRRMDQRTDGRTAMSKVRGDFRNYVNAPKTQQLLLAVSTLSVTR
jgi:hypothetical protein